jgi:hypothetical protein
MVGVFQRRVSNLSPLVYPIATNDPLDFSVVFTTRLPPSTCILATSAGYNGIMPP